MSDVPKLIAPSSRLAHRIKKIRAREDKSEALKEGEVRKLIDRQRAAADTHNHRMVKAKKVRAKLDTQGVTIPSTVATRLFKKAAARFAAENKELYLSDAGAMMLPRTTRLAIIGMVQNSFDLIAQQARPWMSVFDRKVLTPTMVLVAARQAGVVPRDYTFGDTEIPCDDVPVGPLRKTMFAAAKHTHHVLVATKTELTEERQKQKLQQAAAVAAEAAE